MNGTPVFHKCELLLTQRCGLKCDYCHIIRNPVEKECDTAEWKTNFTMLKALGLKFLVLYGGEPLIRKDFPELIDHLNEIELPYTVITNGVTNVKVLEKVLPKLNGFTVSIDFPRKYQYVDDDSYLKSMNGWEWIRKAKDAGVKDITVCTTVHGKNVGVLQELSNEILDMDVWHITTLLHHSTDDSYTYRANTNEVMQYVFGLFDMELLKELGEWFKKQFYAGRKVHNIPAYYDLWGQEVCLALDWKCKGFQCLSIMPDGTLRPCLDLAGEGTLSKRTIRDLYLNSDSLQFELDYIVGEDVKRCGGCFWDPKFMSEWLQQTEITKKYGHVVFDHLLDTRDRVEMYRLMEKSVEEMKWK